MTNGKMSEEDFFPAFKTSNPPQHPEHSNFYEKHSLMTPLTVHRQREGERGGKRSTEGRSQFAVALSKTVLYEHRVFAEFRLLDII